VRTYEQLVEDAITLRRWLISEGRDPASSEIKCSHAELALLKMQPYPSRGGILNEAGDELCGIKCTTHALFRIERRSRSVDRAEK
jgi:hypothetical protein